MQLNGRHSYSRGVYPGFSWFALLCVAVMLLEFNSSRLSPQSSQTVRENFTLLAFGQCLLIWLRSKVYCALSFSRDIQNQTVAIVRVTPISKTSALLAKLCASLAPLWTELALFLPVSLLFFSVYLKHPALLVFTLTPLLFCLSLIAGCLGLCLGSLTNKPNQAMRSARFATFFLFALLPILKGMFSSWSLPLLGLSFWLMLCSKRAPHRRLFLATSGLVVAALSLIAKFEPFSLSIDNLHPNLLISSYYRNSGYAVDWHADFTSLWGLCSYPISVCVIYLLIGVAFFWAARSRFKYS